MNYASLTLFSLCTLTALAQPAPTPTAPEQLAFANLTVRLDADARRLVQQDINALMSNRQYWNAKLDRALLYFPIIESVLLAEDIPADIKYLALQESSLTPDAVSSSQAVGFWQFKRETALDYGLTVNEAVDERKNISASTRGTARYLRRSYGMYANWVSALYSFYLGTGGISKLVPPDWANAGTVTVNGQTDRYILRFFAHKLAVEYAIKTYRPVNTFALVEYTGGAGKTINDIAAELSLNPGDIRTYNRWLLLDHVPADKPYVLTIPTPNGQINDLRQRMAQTTNKPTPPVAAPVADIGFPVLRRVTGTDVPDSDPILYEFNGLPGIQAQIGDNSGSLARKARISLSSFLRYNDLGERTPLVRGEVYYLAKKRKKALIPFHTARPDETMRDVSQRYGLRLKKLVRYNRMDRVQKLQVGRVLWLRERRPAKKPIEVITSPTPPVYDNSPATPTNRPVADPGREADVAVSSSAGIPRTASERRRYRPKLVGDATPMTAPTTPSTPMTTPAAQPAPTTVSNSPAPAVVSADVPLNRPAAPTPTVTTAPATRPNAAETPVVAPPDAGSPQRTIIVRSEGEAVRERTTPARPLAGTYPATPDPAAPASVEPVRSRPVDAPVTTPKQTPHQPAERTPLPRNQPGTLPPLPPMTTRPDLTATTGKTANHTVGAGQTYYSLARYYGVSVTDLMQANNLTPDDKLAVGQVLTVSNIPAGYPTGSPTSPAPAPATAPSTASPLPPVVNTPPAAAPAQHTVAKGETLYRIARLYNVTVEQLRTWNDLPDLGVKEGQKLIVSQ